MRLAKPVGIACISAAAFQAHAWEFRSRFVERIGNTDVPLVGGFLDATDFQPARIRVQFGVFDDATGPAPDGGFIGWNVGAMHISGPADSSHNTRTPGRLAPFTFGAGVNANGNPPLPHGDPFRQLMQIDATLGIQSPLWTCGPDGQPLPMPAPTIRGRNSYVSVFEITTDPRDFSLDSYTITVTGNVLAASEWRMVGTPTPPDCEDPQGPFGTIVYAPFPLDPQSLSAQLDVIVPAPAAGPLLGVLLMSRRTRVRGVRPTSVNTRRRTPPENQRSPGSWSRRRR